MMGCIGALTWVSSCWTHHLQLLINYYICMVMPGHRTGQVIGTVFAVDPGVQHPYDIHS